MQNLHDLLQKDVLSTNDWKVIINHPSVLNSKSSYIERAWNHFLHGDGFIRNQMEFVFWNIIISNWDKNIPPITPVQNMFNFGAYETSLQIDLLCYHSVRTTTLKPSLFLDEGLNMSPKKGIALFSLLTTRQNYNWSRHRTFV